MILGEAHQLSNRHTFGVEISCERLGDAREVLMEVLSCHFDQEADLDLEGITSDFEVAEILVQERQPSVRELKLRVIDSLAVKH